MRTELLARFIYRPPLPETNRATEDARKQCQELADKLDHILPESAEKRLAIRKLEEVLFWSRAAIERHSPPDFKSQISNVKS
ncbi:MAG TPA: hypothetical protein VN281_04350 [Verrucomicrobiae bacterium]|jgi:hypothetical protein|nr:hypothetical protein [Verrucomicrobiae bacterium]